MYDCMTPWVEIQPLLPHGSRGKQERSERRVESRPDGVEPTDHTISLFDFGEPQRVPTTKPYSIDILLTPAPSASLQREALTAIGSMRDAKGLKSVSKMKQGRDL